HVFLDHLRQRTLPERQQRKRKTVDTHVIVLIKLARLLERTRFAFSSAKLLNPNKVVRFAEYRAFPFARLVCMVTPGDLRIMRRVIAAILYIVPHRIIYALDHSAVNR